MACTIVFLMKKNRAMLSCRGIASGRSGASVERIAGAFVQTADLVTLVSVLGHLEIGADEQLRRKLLDRETDGFRRPRKAPVPERLPPGLAAHRREHLGFGAV